MLIYASPFLFEGTDEEIKQEAQKRWNADVQQESEILSLNIQDGVFYSSGNGRLYPAEFVKDAGGRRKLEKLLDALKEKK